MDGSRSGLVVDVRGLTPELRRPILFAVIDTFVELDSRDNIVLIADHEPAHLGRQIEVRVETKGRFDFFCDQRVDGTWVGLLRSKTF